MSDERDDERSEPPALEGEVDRFTDALTRSWWAVDGSGRQGYWHVARGEWRFPPKRNALCDHIERTTRERLAAELAACRARRDEGTNHGLDTDRRVCFYEQEFYPLSNFSSFSLLWKGLRFDTSEAAYHWEKFPESPRLREEIRTAPSAHAAFKLAEQYRSVRRKDWDAVKVGIMREILLAKIAQHEYVGRKLLETGDRELVENSWRDDFWGWGPNRDGQNMLGRLWMQLRSEMFSIYGATATAMPAGEET